MKLCLLWELDSFKCIDAREDISEETNVFYLFPAVIVWFLVFFGPCCIFFSYGHELVLNMQNALTIVCSDQIL